MNDPKTILKIAVIYDGGYLNKISDYYKVSHPRKRNIDLDGLQRFIKERVASLESIDKKYCRIIDAHYFRGRYTAEIAQKRERLYSDRVFEDMLVRVGIQAHYLPVKYTVQKGDHEKGIDVWFALETYELAVLKGFDIVVLVTGDGDHISLVQKLHGRGIKTLVLAWNVNHDFEGIVHGTHASQELMEEATYILRMDEVIGDLPESTDNSVNEIFGYYAPSTVTKPLVNWSGGSLDKAPKTSNHYPSPAAIPSTNSSHTPNASNDIIDMKAGIFEGYFEKIKEEEGYGFLRCPQINKHRGIFFVHSDITNMEFNEIDVGDRAKFKVGTTQRGERAIEIEVFPSKNRTESEVNGNVKENKIY